MYLKRAEIKGFKSFADKIEMDFGPGITAVVGPNGSGKSNIADAVRWVLGEQSAKSLRGSRMEDVIFAGTENRKALGFAEVSLTIDNRDNILPIDYSEVMVTRRVFRSGESEYYLNKTGCRLKDIVELFMDTGVGKEGYSIIGQGRIDEILSSKSEDRRQIFEEAAGIVKYKSRKEEAEKKLEKTKENLIRLNDIIDELQKQLDPLERQSREARQYLELKERLSELEINILVRHIERLSRQKNLLSENIKEYRQSVYEKNNMKAAQDEAFNILKNRTGQIEEELKNIREKLYSRLNLVEKKEGEIKVINQKIESLNEKNSLHMNEIAGLKEEIELLEREKEDKGKAIAFLKNDIDEKKEILAAFQENFDSIGVQVGEDDQNIEMHKSQIIDNLNRVSSLNSKANSLKTLNESMYKRKMQIMDEIQQTEGQISGIKKEIDTFSSRIDSITTQYKSHEKNMHGLRKKIEQLSQREKTLRETVESIKNKLRSAVSRHQVLQDMESSFEGYTKSVKALLSARKNDRKLHDSIVGTVAQLIHVPQNLEKAIEVALGYSVQNLVTHTEEDAKRAIEFLKRNKLGRATFLPISSIRPRRLSDKETAALSMKGCIGNASGLVQCPEKIRDIIDNLLGRVVIVDNMDNGIAMARSFGYSFKIVTVEGDVLNTGGSISGGSSLSGDSGLLQRKREIELMESRISGLEERVGEEEKSLALVMAEMQNTLSTLEKVKQQMHSLDLEQTRIKEGLEGKKKDIADREEKVGQLLREKEQLESDYQETLCTIDRIQEEISEIEKQNREYQENIKALQKKTSEKKQDRENILQQITSNRVEIARLSQRLEDLQDTLQQSLTSIQKYQQTILEKEKDMELNKKNILHLEHQKEAVLEEIQQLKEEDARDNQEIIRLQQLKDSCQQRLIEKEEATKAVDSEIDRLEEKCHKSELKLARVETELNNLHDKIWEEYEITYIEALDYKKDIDDYDKAEKEVIFLKNKIKSFGNVNINAIEDYDRVKTRYEFLNTQKDDLVEARNSLTKVIDELTASMKKQFSSQFRIINEKFNEVFGELFGGGKAQLVLLEEDNVLESGIDIVAQPPGKKLQHLTLLSGGEKALTAIALLFAILMVKPTPFCILDEIEAALDDANVDRFCNFLRNLSKATQFIVITHRKRTMEISDTLYGITMEEKGISKMVSIRLEDKVS